MTSKPPDPAASAQAYLAAIVESSDDAIIAKDLQGVIQSCNAAAERMFGYPAAELIGRPVRILIPPDRQSEEDDILARIARGERVDHFETLRITRDGRPIDISLTISPVRDSSGAVIGASKIARDITERKRIAAEIAAHQAWFRVTLGSIGDGVIASDADGRVTYLNAMAERLTGWTVDDATGRPLDEVFRIIDERTRRPVDNPAALVIRSGHVVGLANHTVLISRDGIERPIADSAAPILDEAKRILGVVLVFRDVSDRRRAETERHVAATERERLLEAERAARAEAERANRLKDDFVAMVSHELRTPLNAILGWTDLMMRNRDDPAMLERGLEIVGRNTRVQAQLISDLLDMSRIVSGKLQLEFQNVDPLTVVEQAVDTVRPSATTKGVDIRCELDSDVGPIAGDPARLQQIVWNLLSNAIKFTPAAGRVTVRLRQADERVEVVVADTGVGIRPDFLPQIFQRFRQADGSVTRGFGGLGLGLAIVKHLVELHGGTIGAESAGEGQGATFTVVLPSSRLLATAAAPAVTGAAALDPVSLGDLRLLVVEDEADTADFLRRLLEAHGAKVLLATSAREALDLLPSERPDIVISDIGLPRVDGYELIQRIREREAGRSGGIPAVALTAFARSEDRTRALRAGYQAHIAKPVESAEVVATIASLAELVTSRRRS